MLRFRKTAARPKSAASAGSEEGTREDHLEDGCAAADLAGALSRAGSGRPQRQSVALFCDLCRRDRRADPGIDAGRRGRHHRPDVRGYLRICRARSEQGAALDAGRLFRKHGMADRRRLRVLDRLSQERARPPARASAGAQPRPAHASGSAMRSPCPISCWRRRRRPTPRAAAAPSIRSSATSRASTAPNRGQPPAGSAPM